MQLFFAFVPKLDTESNKPVVVCGLFAFDAFQKTNCA